MIKKFEWIRIGTIFFMVLFICSAVYFEIFELGTLPAQFFGALLGVVITAIITVLLLQGQTKNEEAREINLKVFEKKQEVYFGFLEKLNHILQDVEFKVHLSPKETVAKSAVNLQDLLFEFGYLQMHTSAGVFDQILSHVARLMEESNQLRNGDELDRSALNLYYASLTTEFFAIVSLLKTDLYSEQNEKVDNEKIKLILLHSMNEQPKG